MRRACGASCDVDGRASCLVRVAGLPDVDRCHLAAYSSRVRVHDLSGYRQHAAMPLGVHLPQCPEHREQLVIIAAV